MARKKIDGPSRQLFAKINENVYLAAKNRAAQQRISMRELLEEALELYLRSDVSESPDFSGDRSSYRNSTVWDDEYLQMLADRPIGSPLELSEDEAKDVARRAFE